MKKTICLFLAICSLIMTASAQNARKDAAGNYHALKYPADSVDTHHTYTDNKGQVYPVFSTGKGKLYYGRTSPKTGKYYRSFLRIEGEIKN